MASPETTASFAGSEITTHTHLEFRWVQVDEVWYLLRRNWLKREATTSFLGVDIALEGQYFLGLTMPWGAGSARLIATWLDADYGILPVEDDFIKGEIVDSMINQGDQVEGYLDGD